MQLEKIENIVFLKNIESNIIQEALVVLKDNVKIRSLNSKNKKIKSDANIIKEAEMIINEEIKNGNIEYEKTKIKKIMKRYKYMKIVNVFLMVSLLLLIFL